MVAFRSHQISTQLNYGRFWIDKLDTASHPTIIKTPNAWISFGNLVEHPSGRDPDVLLKT